MNPTDRQALDQRRFDQLMQRRTSSPVVPLPDFDALSKADREQLQVAIAARVAASDALTVAEDAVLDAETIEQAEAAHARRWDQALAKGETVTEPAPDPYAIAADFAAKARDAEVAHRDLAAATKAQDAEASKHLGHTRRRIAAALLETATEAEANIAAANASLDKAAGLVETLAAIDRRHAAEDVLGRNFDDLGRDRLSTLSQLLDGQLRAVVDRNNMPQAKDPHGFRSAASFDQLRQRVAFLKDAAETMQTDPLDNPKLAARIRQAFGLQAA